MQALQRHQLPPPFMQDLWSIATGQAVPWSSRSLVVAVATVGDECVGGDFEEAEAFLLYEKSDRHTGYIGRQPCTLAAAGNDPSVRARLLAECDLVLCANISDNCRKILSILGVECDLTHAGDTVNDAVAAV